MPAVSAFSKNLELKSQFSTCLLTIQIRNRNKNWELATLKKKKINCLWK